MDKKNRRSSLRRQPPTKEDDQTATSTMQNSMLKRRISFSGKKSVRVFVNTEEPHYWENSYELSDCTNGEDNSKEQAPKTGPSRQAPTADKENVHIDMTLNLRTSIDVPMFPCETNRDPPNCSVPRESLFAESFSLSSIGREKLKDKLYSHRITDKTIDLMQITSKVGDDCSLDLSTLKKEHMKGQPTTFVSDSLMDITPLGFVDPVAASVPVPVEKDNDNPVQKSFKEVEECRKDSQRQGDISFDCDINDFSARDRMPSNGSSDTDSNNSTINYLGDESALIPFDMISGNNISKKLNFRQLNDDLEAGKIKVFANGPRTPTTDPRAKQKKFWHGLDEDLDQDQQHKDINIRSIKPRGPLNFSVNMTMSPLAQATPVARVAPLPREKLKIPDDKRKYRLSQADEVMLDNTNFLAHAKLGDETQSRNSSKIFTRRETTYESLELDVGLPNRSSSCSQNFPPSTMQEAASKHSKPRQTIHLPAKMEQDVFQVEQAATAIPPGRSSSSSARRTLNLNESMDQDIVEEKAIVTQSEVNVTHKGAKSKRRETLLMEESMEEDIISPLKELHLKASAPPKEKEKSKTRQTLHLAKPLEEDEALPRNAATTVAIGKDSKHLAEAVQERLPMGNHRYKARQTILQAEPIEEDFTGTGATRKDYEHLPEARYKARQTILQAEPIEEDVTAPGATRKDYEHLPEAVQKHLPMANHRYKARQTILQAETIEEDVTGPGATRKDYEHLPEARYKARQTILQAEPMGKDVTAPEATRKEYEHLPEAVQKHLPMANHRYKARQTILQAETIEEDVTGPGATRKDYEHLPEARYKARQTILQAEPIEEDVTAPGATRKDYEHLPEAVQKHLPMANHRYKARQTILQAETIEEDVTGLGATRKDYEHLPEARYKARQTILQAEPMGKDVTAPEATRKEYEHLPEAVQKHLPMANHRYKARQTILQAETIEEDVTGPGATRKDYEHLPEARYKARQTILQAEPIEEDVTAPGATRKDYEHLPEAVQKHLPMANHRYKARQTILQAETIEEDVTGPGATRKDYEHLPEARYKARQTILQAEPIEEDVTAPGATRKDYEHLPEAVQKHLPMANHRYKARQTILQAETIEEDVTGPGATRKDYEHLPDARYKARQTILQAEPIEEDFTAPGATRKDYEHLPEAVQKHLPMANHRHKARQTILQAEPIEEDVTAPGATRKNYEHLPEARYKARQTILQAEPIEEDVTAPGATRKDYEHLPEAVQKHLPMANHRYKARQTILQAEPIEEDVTAPGATRKDYEHLPEAVQKHLPMANHRYKARQTILQAEPIEEDVTAPGATRKDYEHLPEAIQKHLPTGNHRYKARQTILQAEPIEEDVTAPEATRKDYEHLPEAVQKHLPTGNHRYKARQTILQAEPVEEDVTRKDYEHLPEAIKEHLPTGNHRYKCRQTILQAEPIEEDVTPRKDCEHLPEKKDYKHLAEPVQAHHVSDSRYRSSKSRQALLMAEAIEENHSTAYHSLEPKISQEVRENSVAFEPINTLPLSELIEESKAAIRTSKARQTLPLAAPMEVEGEEPPTEPPLEESTKVAPSRGSRAQQTLIMSESMEEQEEEVDFHSPIQSIRTHPELLPITPMLRLNGSGSVCSMDEFELFEEESKQAATPRGPFQKASVLLRKIHSMGESMKMSFEEDTSGCGTPIRHSGNAKRLSDHLTPNLPEAKKRNTHLFADSKTEQEMEMEMDMSVSIKEVTTAVDKNCDLILRPQRPVLEQRPVTISDVSAYFQAQPCKVKKKPAESKTEKEDEEKRDTCPRYSGSSTDRSFKSYEPTNKRFINLSGDTNSSTALMGTISVDEMETSHIDKVRLSLVSTLADEPDTDEEAPVEGAAALAKQPQPEPESCQEQQASSRVVAAGSSASCRKCMNCRRSLNETRLSNDSFVLPSQPQWDLTREIEMLRRVRARPNLDDVHKYWEMKEQERQTIALEKELDNSRDASDEEEFSEWDVNEVMAGYNRKMERFKRNLADNPDILQQALVRFEPVETFFDRLAGLLTEQQPNWIFDYQLKISRKLIFTHRLLTTFRLIVDYETVDDLETAIRVCALNVEQATLILPLQSWTAFEHLLDFQLQLKLPVSHTDSIEGSSVEAFAQFLQRTDTICVDVLRTFHKLLKVLTTTKASLLRQGNQMVIKKTVRRRIEMDTRTAIEKTDFVIEVANVEGISFRDILHPRIHLFNENIQYLPVGVAFLEEFLDHPEQYLKT
ncbi:uncharacterized protein Spc105R isoform X3 [Drosophila pseudoobscura]|uniref:Uncharacterized protein Spc105R isoform X3 n=1 Tax=Drosophila pseudoobscura pseudoobscura TaxID=46245 RepID=A0A6I8WBB5_DROPS|nr:uncharacterized protein LOC6900295 isoform X3 [Drosophila pseudoobscura]